MAVAASTQTALSGTVFFSNSNNLTFGMSNSSVVTASYSQSNQQISAYAVSNTITTRATSSGILNAANLSFQGVGNASVGISNGSVVVSAPIGISLSAGTSTANLAAVTFSNSNGVSFGLNGSTVTASHDALALSAANGSSTFQTASFANSNGVSFSTGTQGIYASVQTNYLTTARASNDAIGLNTAESNVTWTVNSSGLSLNAAGYAGTGTTFNGANISGSITHNSVGLNLSLSAAAPGAGGGIALYDGANSITSGTAYLSDANGVSLGINGQTVTASVAPAITWSYFNPLDAYLQVTGVLGQSSLFIQPMQAPNVQFDRVLVPTMYSNNTSGTGSYTVSLFMGTYTRNNSTLSLLSSNSTSYNMSNNGTVGSYSLYGGIRLMSMATTGTLTEGQYYVGMMSMTATGGLLAASMSNIVASQQNSSFSGIFGQASITSAQYTRGLGRYSVATAGIPNAIGFTDIQGNSSAFIRQPLFYMVSGTF